MKTHLFDKYLPRFESLTDEEVARTWGCVRAELSARRVTTGSDWPDPENGSELFDGCRGLEFDLCRVIMCMAREHDPVGRAAIEKLSGVEIVPWAASLEQADVTEPAAPPAPSPLGLLPGQTKFSMRAGQRPGASGRARSMARDPRVVQFVTYPCPHKDGSQAAANYEHWREGDTVDACMRAGLPARSVRRDVRFGYVILGPERR